MGNLTCPFSPLPASIETANRHAQEQEITNVSFSVATAKGFPGNGYGFVTVFDALHDMGDPVGAASHVKESLQPDGTFMIVEPLARDSLAENINPVGRVYYGFSTMICTPGSLSQEVGLALGAQAGERQLRDVLSKGGFTRVRRAAETPFQHDPGSAPIRNVWGVDVCVGNQIPFSPQKPTRSSTSTSTIP